MRHTHTLTTALLFALGLAPLACGGTTTNPDGGGRGGSPPVENKPACTPGGDAPEGYVTCQEGYTYRATTDRCSARADGSGAAPAPNPKPRVTEFVDCSADPSVCDAYQYGYCPPISTGFQVSRGCASGCTLDSECGEGSSCRCGAGEQVGSCVYDYCDTDSDCEPGYHCASSDQGCGSSAFSCQTAQDECFGTLDCKAGEICRDSGDGHRRCSTPAVCGRPFLVAEAPRLPAVVARGDWSDAVAPRVDHLTFAERAAFAQHWTKLGQMEHASIAAFARFSLQLLALGAPADLVEACTRALADETAHAKLCFGIASAYAGRAIGPGPLDVSNSLELSSLADIVDLVILEGCIGETTAALDALESADSASDPVIRDAYSRIAADELRHAELAFRFVQWALERDRSAVLPRLDAALRSASASPAFSQVVQPCLRALTVDPAAAA